MKKFVNLLSAFRIFAAFAIIPLLMFQLYWLAFILFVLGAASDWLDGFLARKYNVTTKLGGVMDHIGDKLLVVNTLIMLTIMMPIWFIVIPVIILIARELYVSGLREFLGTQKIEMPVPKARFSMGKIKTTLQMITIGLFLLLFAMTSPITLEIITRASMTIMHLLSKVPTPTTLESIKLGYLMSMNIISQIGIIGIWLALVASIWSATQYTITFAEKLKKIK